MVKINPLQDFGSSYLSWQALNANNTRIEDALANTLSRDGSSPNQMETVLDMNSNRVINLGEPVAGADAVRFEDLQNALAAFNPGPTSPVGSVTVFLSQWPSLPEADAAAFFLGGSLVIDKNYTLTASYTLTCKGLLFTGGVITLGSYDLTFAKQTILTAQTQVFNSTSTGKVKGLILGDICLDWWGATSTSVLDPTTTNAGNDCLAYVMQSMDGARGDNLQVYCTQKLYFLSGPWVKTRDARCPCINGNGALLRYEGIGSEVPAIRIIGISGAAPGATIKSFQFEGDTTSVAIEVQGQCFVNIEEMQFRDNGTAIVLHNKDSGDFTEVVTWRNCSFGSKRAWYFKRTSGDGSFHGSGPDGNCIVNYPSGMSNSPIKLDPGSIVYNAPFSAGFWPTTNAYPLIEIAGAACYLILQGDCTIENFWGTGSLTMVGGTTPAACSYTGSLNTWGGGLILGPLVLFETTSILNDGVIRGRRKGFMAGGAMVAGGTSYFVSSATSTDYLMSIFINLADYEWKGLVVTATDPFGNNDCFILRTQITGGANYGSWGPPTLSWNGSNLSVTNANYTASGTVSVGVTDLGKAY